MASNGNNSVSYSDKLWALIKKEWLAGQLSLSEISRSYGPSRPAILKRAKSHKWPARGTLVQEVRREINTALITDKDPSDEGGVTAGVTPEEQSEIIGAAASRGLGVVRVHRGLLHRLLAQVDVTLSEMEEMKRIRLDLLTKTRLKDRKAMVTAIIGNRISAMDSVSKVLAKAIPLERQAFSLDSDGEGVQSIRYVAPELGGKKPKNSGLSEDAWEDEESGEKPNAQLPE